MEAKTRIAILDMNRSVPNQGLRCICNLVSQYTKTVEYDVFDVRTKNEVPNLSYDLYISSGGPGSPTDGNGIWEKKYFKLLDRLWIHNENESEPENKKYCFFICHSFQLVSMHFDLGMLAPRNSTAFGIFPVHKTAAGKKDVLFEGLTDPFYAIDSRDFQLIQPKKDKIKQLGGSILALEKVRQHVDYERAVMAIRFSPEWAGTQFHPEGDPAGMLLHFSKPSVSNKIIEQFGRRKYNQMIRILDQPQLLLSTYQTVIPKFIERALEKLNPVVAA